MNPTLVSVLVAIPTSIVTSLVTLGIWFGVKWLLEHFTELPDRARRLWSRVLWPLRRPRWSDIRIAVIGYYEDREYARHFEHHDVPIDVVNELFRARAVARKDRLTGRQQVAYVMVATRARRRSMLKMAEKQASAFIEFLTGGDSVVQDGVIYHGVNNDCSEPLCPVHGVSSALNKTRFRERPGSSLVDPVDPDETS